MLHQTNSNSGSSANKCVKLLLLHGASRVGEQVAVIEHRLDVDWDDKVVDALHLALSDPKNTANFGLIRRAIKLLSRLEDAQGAVKAQQGEMQYLVGLVFDLDEGDEEAAYSVLEEHMSPEDIKMCQGATQHAMPQPLLDAHDAAADVCNGSLTKLDQEILRSIFAELDVILDAPCCVIKHSELLAAATNPSSDLPFISPGQLNALAGGEVAGGSEEAACSLSSVAAVQVIPLFVNHVLRLIGHPKLAEQFHGYYKDTASSVETLGMIHNTILVELGEQLGLTADADDKQELSYMRHLKQLQASGCKDLQQRKIEMKVRKLDQRTDELGTAVSKVTGAPEQLTKDIQQVEKDLKELKEVDFQKLNIQQQEVIFDHKQLKIQMKGAEKNHQQLRTEVKALKAAVQLEVAGEEETAAFAAQAVQGEDTSVTHKPQIKRGTAGPNRGVMWGTSIPSGTHQARAAEGTAAAAIPSSTENDKAAKKAAEKAADKAAVEARAGTAAAAIPNSSEEDKTAQKAAKMTAVEAEADMAPATSLSSDKAAETAVE